MAYYNICPQCGAHLDPGEKCSCMEERELRQRFFEQQLRVESKGGQYAFVFDGQETGSKEKAYC